VPLRISLAIALLLLAGVALFLLPDPGSGAKQDPARSGRAAPASDFRDSGTGEDEEPPSSGGGTIRGSVLTPEGLSAGGARVRLLRVRWPARLSSTGSSLAGSVFQLDLTSDALVLFSDLTDSWTDESETTADEQGVFRFPSVPEGTYLVCASSVASVWSTDGLLISCPGSSEFSADIAIRLRPALDVQLRVLGDERPVEGARITLSGFLGERSERPADVPLSVSRIWELILNPPAAELWTDSAGFARISTLPALDYVVRAGSPDHGRIETTYSVWEPGVNCLPREGADPVRIETRPKVLRLTAGVPIEGLVVDPQGFPIRGATLFLLREPGLKGKLLTPAIRQDVVSTDASGQYRFDHVPTGVYTILVEKFGFVPQLKEDFFSETAAALPLDFTLEPGGVLPGVVLDEAGLPLSGVVVRSAGKLGSVVSDEQGRFEVVANQYGGALATFSHPCFSSAAVVLINPVEPKEVTLQRMPEVRGRVIDPGGRPIEGASVELRAPRDLAGFSDPASGALQKDNYLGATAAAGALISDRDGRFSGCPAPGSGLGGAASAVHIFAPGFERRIEPLGTPPPRSSAISSSPPPPSSPGEPSTLRGTPSPRPGSSSPPPKMKVHGMCSPRRTRMGATSSPSRGQERASRSRRVILAFASATRSRSLSPARERRWSSTCPSHPERRSGAASGSMDLRRPAPGSSSGMSPRPAPSAFVRAPSPMTRGPISSRDCSPVGTTTRSSARGPALAGVKSCWWRGRPLCWSRT